MEKQILAATRSSIQGLGIYQSAGAAIGLFKALRTLFQDTDSSSTMIAFFVSLIFFGYSIYAGTRCIFMKDDALKHSFINQLLQFIGFAISGVMFKYVAGLQLNLLLDLTTSIQIGIRLAFSEFSFDLSASEAPVILELNLAALGMLIWIETLTQRIKKEKELTS